MSQITIRLTDPHDPQATALLKASHALMQELFEPEDSHYLEISDLCADQIRFFAAWRDDLALGCIALANMGDYGEIKSLFVSPDVRGTGTGALLLDHLEAEARSQNISHLRLETGDTLHAAHRLYRRAGYIACGPFGNYVESPASVFMEKHLAP